MINLTETLVEYLNRDRKARRVGRYNVSDLWAINNGYISPEEYTDLEILDFVNAFRMWQGTTKHAQLAPLLEAKGYKTEVKKEYSIEDIVLVGKADAIKEDEIMELKTSMNSLNKAKKWHEHQVRCYLSMFEKKKGIICQPAYNSHKLYLKVLGEVKRNDKWFEKEIEKLLAFHKKCQQHAKEKLGT